MIEIKLRDKESELKLIADSSSYETHGIDKALFRLRKKMDREKVMDEVKARRYFEKPSVKRKRARDKAKYRQKMRRLEWE